jgi:hypothetical protein
MKPHLKGFQQRIACLCHSHTTLSSLRNWREKHLDTP